MPNPLLSFLSRVGKSPVTGDIVGAALGAGAGELASRGEEDLVNKMKLEESPLGHVATRVVNLPLFTALGTRWGRKMFRDIDPLTKMPGGYSASSVLKGTGAKGLMMLAPPILDQVAQFSGSINRGAKGVGDAGGAISNLSKMVDSAANGDNTHYSLGESLRKFTGGAGDLGEGMSGAGELGKSLGKIDPNRTAQNFDKTLAALSGGLDTLGAPIRHPWVTAGAIGGAAAGVGGYQLLRDWLNYRRVKKEREAKQQPALMAPKVAAAIPWKAMNWGQRAKVVLPAAGIGAAEAWANYDPNHPWTAMIGGTLGAFSGSKLLAPYKGSKPLVNALAPYMVGAGAVLPRTLAGVAEGTEALRLHNADASSSHLLRNAGIAALGAGGLYSLLQMGNAAKSVSEGNPLVQANTTNNVTAGGGGGEGGGEGAPGGPGQGTLHVSLPARNDRDHETSVEIPLERIGLSNNLMSQIRRDTKRRLRMEGQQRTHHITPAPAPIVKMGSVLNDIFIGHGHQKVADSPLGMTPAVPAMPAMPKPPMPAPSIPATTASPAPGFNFDATSAKPPVPMKPAPSIPAVGGSPQPGFSSAPIKPPSEPIGVPGLSPKPVRGLNVTPELNHLFMANHGTTFNPHSAMDRTKMRLLMHRHPIGGATLPGAAPAPAPTSATSTSSPAPVTPAGPPLMDSTTAAHMGAADQLNRQRMGLPPRTMEDMQRQYVNPKSLTPHNGQGGPLLPATADVFSKFHNADSSFLQSNPTL